MRKYQKAAVVMAMLGSVSFLGAGVSQAGDGPGVDIDTTQTNACKQSGDAGGAGLVNALNDVNVGIGILGQGVDDSVANTCANAAEIG
ncbi:hypothetical protein ACFWWT_35280 [Streptomyces sp. NPDC058676]|uniref:hypothetical protein n=1 Tax=unclassified Streptomyces TaxID=2593676 RepID=UPI00365A2763